MAVGDQRAKQNGRLFAWTIGLQIRDTRMDAEGLNRLLAVFDRDARDFDAECALWSGVVAVHGTVKSATALEALGSALTTVSSAFDQAGIDGDQTSEVTNITVRRG